MARAKKSPAAPDRIRPMAAGAVVAGPVGVPAPRAPHTGRRAEAQRMDDLHKLEILDTQQEQIFDDLVLLASRLAGVPIALVSLIDHERQWFKAKVGLDVCSTGRDVAFCDHVVRDEAELEVIDASLDPRFADNPLVTGPPNIRFYAGFPLLTSAGSIPGTLCVIGTEPNRLDEEQKEFLRALARQVVVQLELRLSNAEQAREIELRRQAERALADSESVLAAIGRVVRRIQSGEDPREAIVTAAREIGETDSASLIERSSDSPGMLVVTSSAGRPTTGTTFRLDDPTSISAQVWHSGESQFIPDAASRPDLNPALLSATGGRSLLWQPIITKGEVTGILSVTWDQVISSLSERSAKAVLLLADEASVALAHAALMRRYEELATTDELTGLPNRRYWDDRIGTLIGLAERTGVPLVVAIADVDRFKSYNDTRGHLEGDVLLREIGTEARRQLRAVDVVARWGGEEFAIALPGCTAQDALTVLNRVRLAMPRQQTMSIGFTQWMPGASAESMMQQADSALYEAKNGGRNRVVPAGVTF